jgi:dipeptidyl aminopeptidase/acylaminoacyl peptidase
VPAPVSEELIRLVPDDALAPHVARMIGELVREVDALPKRSAIRWVAAIPKNIPILVQHGTADWRVSPSQAFEMARALAESGIRSG